MKLLLPIVREGQQCPVERLWLRILARWRERGVTLAVYNFDDLAVFNSRRAVPGVDDVFILVRPNVTKHNHFPIRALGDWNHFADGGHPSANQAVVEFALLQRFVQFRRILNGMISASAPAAIDRGDIKSFLRANK